MLQLTLYTTSGCHLCEKAEEILNRLRTQQPCRWVAVEISEDDCLVDRYGLRIPVIVCPQGRELDWPFSLGELNDWLKLPLSG